MNHLRILFSFVAILWSSQAFSVRPELRFKDHRFKIVQFTDLHWINGKEYAVRNDSSLLLIRDVIKKEQPDLVVFTGDIVVSGGAAEAWKSVVQPVSEAKIPFAVTFGNHDTEADISKEVILGILRNNPFNQTFDADKKLSGVGNCALPVWSEDGNSKSLVLYLFDSHSYTNDTTLGYYDWIKNDQIQWYRKQSAMYTQEEGHVVPSLAFFHIPLPEFEIVRNQKITVGSIVEPVCSPQINSGLFASFVEMGDIEGVFVGHDHNDDFAGTLAGICLCYGRKSGFNSAYQEVLERGARIIELKENQKGFITHIRTLSGTSLEYRFTSRE